jgi:periplasmic divalent cation tolerance protein
MSTTDILFLYITCPSKEVAIFLSERAIQEKMAACANIHGPITSLYPWEGNIQNDTEWVLILKTKQAQVEALSSLIEREHPYQIPCILQLPIAGGNPSYLQWLLDQMAD